MAELARNIISAYQAGTQERQDEERRGAISAYLPGALRGDKGQASQLASADPDMGLKVFSYLNGLEENERKRAIEASDRIALAILGPDGQPSQDPALYAHIRTLEKAYGTPEDKLAVITPENAQHMIFANQKVREYKSQLEKDALAKKMAEANIRQSEASTGAANALAKQRQAMGGAGGGAPSGYRYALSPSGEIVLEPIPGGPADTAVKPMTDEQAKAAGFAQRLMMADSQIGQSAISDALQSGYNTTVAEVPFGIGNALVTGDYQQGDQASREFLNAQLRRESGAVIGPTEFTSGSLQYFPQYGDKKLVLAQKAASRKLAIANMFQSAGPRFANEAKKAMQDYAASLAEFRQLASESNNTSTNSDGGSGKLPPPPPGSRLVGK